MIARWLPTNTQTALPSSARYLGADWREWLSRRAPAAVSSPFAPRHVALWEWFTMLAPGSRPRPRVEIWPRGGGKSATAELGCCWVCERGTRHYVLYVSGTQDQADKHVSDIATRLEKLGIQRALNVYGSAKGWRRQELRAVNNFNVSAFGLDTASRGAKIEDYRPDLIIFDDVDDRHDSPKVVERKIESITQGVLPAGSTDDCAVLFIQNRIHSGGVASKLADGRAGFLLDREVVEEPAVVDLKYSIAEQPDGVIRYVITEGVATWEGQSLVECEYQMNTWGIRAFLREAQHQVKEAAGALWKQAWIDDHRITDGHVPDLIRVVTGIDPQGSSKARDAETGIVTGGIDGRTPPHLYILDDASLSATPPEWAAAALASHAKHNADRVVAETNFGGEMVEHTLRALNQTFAYSAVNASRGKVVRAEPVAASNQLGRVHFVGYFPALEEQLTGWVPGQGPSPNRLDALVWIATFLGVVDVATAGSWIEAYQKQAQQAQTEDSQPADPAGQPDFSLRAAALSQLNRRRKS